MNKTDFQQIVKTMVTKKNSNVMNEQMHQIHRQFKNLIKEDVDENKFALKIQEIFTESLDGSTDDNDDNGVTTDPVNNPEEFEKEGEDMKELGQAITDLGKKTKEIKDRAAAVTIKEYVDAEIMPTVLEIIKENENPKSTKRELLKIFQTNTK